MPCNGEGVGLPGVERLLSFREVTCWEGDSPADASVSKNSTQSREKDYSSKSQNICIQSKTDE